MAEFKRTFFCHPKKGAEFDLVLHSRDAIAHSMIGDLTLTKVASIQEILTDASQRIHKILTEGFNVNVPNR